MEKRYSECSIYELQEEMGKLKEQAVKAQQMGMINEYEVIMRKMAMAKAYTMDPNEFNVGGVYEITDEPGVHFTITYFKGVFAWGYRDGKKDQEEQALPISLLKKPEK
ncbi:YfhH family protein [Ectobacillus polymachus]|uniref:YfhH family protein n=1 Tax=Ectobacillus polymachus TaxID=1508806 RepID=UPI003A86F729